MDWSQWKKENDKKFAEDSPTCLASTILIVLALAAQYGWTIRQFDIAKAYMLAAPLRDYYLRFLPGFRDYLLACHPGNLPFEPSQYLLRVQKNIYGATDSGKVWYDTLCSYLGSH